MNNQDALLPLPWSRALEQLAQIQTVGRGAVLAVLLIGLGLGYRLLAEWQRRMTLERMLTQAPKGTIVMQEKSPAGPAMWIWVGGAQQLLAGYRGAHVIVTAAAPGTAALPEPHGRQGVL